MTITTFIYLCIECSQLLETSCVNEGRKQFRVILIGENERLNGGLNVIRQSIYRKLFNIHK